MKYRIKNPEVEKAVRGLFKTQEAYEEALNNSARIKVPYAEVRLICVHGHVSVTGSYCDVHVAVSNIEEVVEYDPKKWNEYPKVKPPKKDIYRVEYHFDSGEVKKESVYFNGETFVTGWLTLNGGVRTYFKPWDDEE